MSGPVPRALAAFATLATLTGARAAAQEAPRAVASSANAWLDVTADVWLAPRLDLQLGGKLQRARLGAAPQESEVRLGVVRPVGRRFRVGVAGLLAHNTPNGPFPARAPYGERRLFQFVLQDQRVGRVALQHRYRLEERWIERPLAPVDGVARAPDVSFAMRARYQLRATTPIGRPAAPHPLYASAYDELFKSVGPHHATTRLDQNRLYGGVGVRWSPVVRAEAGLLEQRIVRANGRQLEHAHTLQVALWLTRRAPRR